MKTLSLLLISALALAAQTVTVNLAVPMQVSVLQDIHQHFLSAVDGNLGTLQTGLDATTANVTVTVVSSQPCPAVGSTVKFDAEPMSVASCSPVSGGLQMGFTRGTFPSTALAVHAAGAQGYVLKYPTPWAMLVDEALRPYTISIIQGLGNKSMTLASGATGTISQ